jgi:ribosomal protein L11 methyltransferase
MNHYQITITPITKNISDIIIALLAEQDYDGFNEEEDTLHCFIPEQLWNEAILIDTLAPFQLAFTKQLIEQRNWNADWESSYEPILINNEVAIRATFHEPITSAAHNIIIVPKMSFGTGHHATTRMMMEFISEINCTNKSVLDYGCGTGVLAIYAAYKGATELDAIDIDEWCVENTLENIGLNKAENIKVLQGDLDIVGNKKYDIILANINLYILLKQMPQFYNMLNTSGELFGILNTDVETLQKSGESVGFTLLTTKRIENWCALQFVKK